MTSFGMGSSVIGELVEMADIALEEGQDGLNGKINDKIKEENTIGGGAKRSNMHPMKPDYESEIPGPASTGGRVNPEMGQWKTEPQRENSKVTVVQVHQQNQTDAVQVNELMGNGQAFSTPLHGLLKASREWPTIAEQEEKEDSQDEWPSQITNMGAPSTGIRTKSPQEGHSPQNPPNKKRGEVASPDNIIETINASLLFAVKALTWQSHKMEIHLELTHMLAQSLIALDSKVNALCGKLDNRDHSRRKEEAVVGSRNDEIIDKLATQPDL
ncbi:hypothetical protein NDU88_003727 [Pleurodeles waltl]|uniref:Phosphoprotein n=1 Tax=Pleurodeles waltl TaxID=8319 RepID=A0AAV7PAV7_PLEWA|nr:hypothetical protein NDU88_003727 [Pleurodeles waltl]